jgi:hypothetical protein
MLMRNKIAQRAGSKMIFVTANIDFCQVSSIEENRILSFRIPGNRNIERKNFQEDLHDEKTIKLLSPLPLNFQVLSYARYGCLYLLLHY